MATGGYCGLDLEEEVNQKTNKRTHASVMVDGQAKDEGIWFVAETCAESYLQDQLRRLHAAVEQDEKEANQQDQDDA